MNDEEVVRAPQDQPLGEVAVGRQVSFVGEVGRAPSAHIPGQPVARMADGTITTRMTAAAQPGVVGTIHVGTAYVGNLTAASVNPTVGLHNWGGPVQFLASHPDAVVPARGTEDAAGYDLTTPEEISFAPNERKAIPLGFALAIPGHLHGRIESRSGLALKGLVALTGVVDADYRGEVKVIMQNFSDKKHTFAAGDRVAQMVLRPTVAPGFAAVAQLSATDRGAGGFGSTGA